MDKDTLKEIAENEVSCVDQPEYNPAAIGLISLFANDIRERFFNVDEAIDYYRELTDEQVERRYCIHYWEECSLQAYNSIRHEAIDTLTKSIDCRELANREINNIGLLFSSANFNLIISNEYLLINEYPNLYEKLLIGDYPDFLNSDEVEAFQAAQDDNYPSELFKFALENPERQNNKSYDKQYLEQFRQLLNEHQSRSPRYVDYFNTNWVAAMQIQALVWYKEYLIRVVDKGTPFISNPKDWMEVRRNKNQPQISMRKLRRSNDGYQVMIQGYNAFQSQTGRQPDWSELMDFLAKNPPAGFIIESKIIKNKVDYLIIEGSERPIDRVAFKKRFERYFPKK